MLLIKNLKKALSLKGSFQISKVYAVLAGCKKKEKGEQKDAEPPSAMIFFLEKFNLKPFQAFLNCAPL